MIKDKSSYYEYLKCDADANGKNRRFCIPYVDIVWKQLRILRKYEYHLNCLRPSFFKKLITTIDRLRYKRISLLTGISIAPNCFGKGLTIYHNGCIVCNPTVKAGDYITLQCGVNIAEDVVIGNNTYLAPGVKIAKNVVIPDNCVIGYNAVVTKSLEYKDSTYVGIPARKIEGGGYVDANGIRRQL